MLLACFSAYFRQLLISVILCSPGNPAAHESCSSWVSPSLQNDGCSGLDLSIRWALSAGCRVAAGNWCFAHLCFCLLEAFALRTSSDGQALICGAVFSACLLQLKAMNVGRILTGSTGRSPLWSYFDVFSELWVSTPGKGVSSVGRQIN